MSYALIGTGFERQISQGEFLAIQTAKQDVILATVAEETFIIVAQKRPRRLRVVGVNQSVN